MSAEKGAPGQSSSEGMRDVGTVVTFCCQKRTEKGKTKTKKKTRAEQGAVPHLSICRGVAALRVSATSQFSPLIHMLTSSSDVAVESAQEKWEEGTEKMVTNPNLLRLPPAS